MNARRVDLPAGAPATPSILERLLVAEREAGERLDAADADAARLVAEATAAATAEDERAVAALATELSRMRGDAESERAAAIEAIGRDAAARAVDYDRADAAAIARRIVELIVRGPEDAEGR